MGWWLLMTKEKNQEATYVSIYSLPEFEGKVVYRFRMELPWNNQKVWNKTKRMCIEKGGQSFAMFEFKTGRDFIKREWE